MKDMSLVMKEAHRLTKEIKKEFPNVDYKFQLGICMSYLLNGEGENEMVELQGSEKQIKWATDIRENTIKSIDRALEKLEEIQSERVSKGRKRVRTFDKRINKLKVLLEEVKNESSSKIFIEEYRSKKVDDFLNIETN
ncbi:TPA: hypothetical protein K8M96_002798 [Clostridium perfringens]|nr:hypothetical protein [Clostridium perfringens]HBI6967489.1 hypothetical protein [Clostridium perfringens]HBI6970485.1 hypothetical protein [Clostridium perfringens]HBI6973491.1 hypothetical protein [Clostridium perfringens]HBI6987535.1 hypothetical protein [Clostridium perfringens]